MFKNKLKNLVQKILTTQENKTIQNAKKLSFAPIIIIGPPRSGTTLIYSSLVKSVELAYFCNFAAKFPLSPATITKLINSFKQISVNNDNYGSNYGVVPGRFSPSQGNAIWARWFPKDQSYVDDTYLNERAINDIFGTVWAIEQIFKKPFINKVQGHSVRIQALHKIFPELCIIRIHREHYFVAQSILMGRRKVFQDDAHWFSAKSSNYSQIADLPPLEQIPKYLLGLEFDMNRDLNKIGTHRVFNLKYEDFCSNPNASIRDFVTFYEKFAGKSLSVVSGTPETFEIDKRIQLSKDEEDMLIKNIEHVGLKYD
ncbi:MAG: sulfotransferase [Pseudomonadota bacterium]